MHNPAMVNLPRAIPIGMPNFGRVQPATDFIPIDVSQQPPPPMYLHHRHPSRYRSHHAFSGNQFYNRTKRKRDSSTTQAADANAAYLPRLPATHPAVNGAASVREGGDRKEKPTPWNPDGVQYSGGIIGLHEEIEAFVQWMVPTPAEHQLRLNVINRLRAAVKEIYPAAVVQVFGSFRTGLYLPTSDIDLVLIGNWDQIPFEVVRRGIEQKNLAKPGSLQLLEHATVPIIKLTDRLTDIKVDISFNMTNGLRSVELIKHFKKRFPAMPKLIYVLKQFLLQRDLNEVYTGGLSSYALILMVVSFLQLHPRGEKAGSEKANLGVLLVEFFELYGRHFNYSNTAIIISDGGAYVSKDDLRGQLTMGTGLGSLCIQDPYLPDNDVGKSSYGIPVVKTAFEQAYLTLTQLLESGAATPANNESLLSQVVKVSDDIIAFRRWVASSSSTSTVPFADADTDATETQASAPAALLSPMLNAHAGNDRAPTSSDNNDDQSLSEDPRLPTQITPTPSRDVLPRELPSKVFGAKKPASSSETAATVVEGVVTKDSDNMSGVSTSTSASSSASSRTDTDSDVIASGSPSSVMSISPASSEVGIRNNRNARVANGHHRQSNEAAADPDSTRFKTPAYNNRAGTRYWNQGSRKTGSQKERSDLDMNWRNSGPDQNQDWRNHDPPQRQNHDRKNSWRDETGSNSTSKSKASSSESSGAESDNKDPKSRPGPAKTSQPSPTSNEISNKTSGQSRVPAVDEVVVVDDEEKSPSTPVGQTETPKPNSNPENCCNKNDPGLVKGRTLNGKKRKKQNRSKNKNNNSNNTSSIVLETEPVKAANNQAVARESSVPKISSLPRDRFSSKSGQCKPNR